MTESRYDHRPSFPGEPTVLSTSDRSRHIDRYLRMLADRRRRYCLYHLLRANEPLSVHDLARLVEASLAPSESAVTERTLEEAARHLVHTHLPKLRDAGLVRVTDGSVSLTPDPPLPVRDWLSTTAAVELDLPHRSEWPTEHPSTEARNDPRPSTGRR